MITLLDKVSLASKNCGNICPCLTGQLWLEFETSCTTSLLLRYASWHIVILLYPIPFPSTTLSFVAQFINWSSSASNSVQCPAWKSLSLKSHKSQIVKHLCESVMDKSIECLMPTIFPPPLKWQCQWSLNQSPVSTSNTDTSLPDLLSRVALHCVLNLFSLLITLSQWSPVAFGVDAPSVP